MGLKGYCLEVVIEPSTTTTPCVSGGLFCDDANPCCSGFSCVQVGIGGYCLGGNITIVG